MEFRVDKRQEAGDIGRTSRLVLIESTRLAFLSVILLLLIALQVRFGAFVAVDIMFPVYSMLAASFFLNCVYLFYFERVLSRIWQGTALLFAADTLLVTGLIQYTGVDKSIFLFVYLVNISLAGFAFQRRGAILIAALTSILFSLLLIADPLQPGRDIYFVLTLNNVAFFAVAVLSGYLSEKMNFMGSEISAREAEIRSLKNLNDLIVENISTGLISCDINRKIIHVNAAAREIIERKNDLRGSLVQALFPAVTPHLDQTEISTTERFELDYRTPRGEVLILGMSVSILHSTGGEPAGLVLIFQDLTRIKRLEKAMRRSEKLAAVGQLAAGIAHEIRNPLASISGSIQMLSTSVSSLSTDEARLMNIVVREIDRLNRLISEFLDFVRPDLKVDDPVDLNSMLKEVLDMAKVNDRIRRDVVQHFASHTNRRILGHVDKLKQCFLNIVLNAYQAMEKVEKAEIYIDILEKHPSSVVVQIRDTGLGMPEEVSNRLFEPFFTTKANGTGLGLAMVHKIIENHGGQIHVESRADQGTQFSIEFTRLDSDAGPKPAHDPSSEDHKIALKFQEEMNRFNLRKRGHG
jgi:two-component system sensor histidine kinase PilS (NtrC family)